MNTCGCDAGRAIVCSAHSGVLQSVPVGEILACDGPSIRDQFAIAALQGWGEAFHGFAYVADESGIGSPPTIDSIAATCYRMADAMLKARKAK